MTYSPDIPMATTPTKPNPNGSNRRHGPRPKRDNPAKRPAEPQLKPQILHPHIEKLLCPPMVAVQVAAPPAHATKRRGAKSESSPRASPPRKLAEVDHRASPPRRPTPSKPIATPKNNRHAKSPVNESPNYAAAKFTSSPSPQVLPLPPYAWVQAESLSLHAVRVKA